MILTKKIRRFNFFLSAIITVMLVVGGLKVTASKPIKGYDSLNQVSTIQTINSSANLHTATPVCLGNTLSNLILVSISSQHLWACAGSSQVYNTPVVTGDENYLSDVTPVGTYKIYAKQVNVTLTGSDESGSRSDPVKYWMPFLNNQYGTYGLHDASWRTPNQFGNISPNSLNASHGCVELPDSAAAWLYNWAPVGTTVTIKN